MLKVATAQYRATNDVQANLQKLCEMIDRAADGGAQLVVAPEFGNHTSFYAHPEQAWEVAITLDGPYLHSVQEKARARSIHVVFNATRRGTQRPTAYITNFLVGPDGALIGYDDKQSLMGGEAQHLSGSDHPGKVFETAIGRIGMMSCLDGVPHETARHLALEGAQIITNTHNSCALDEPFSHIPLRSAENGVWTVAAGKVGPICVDEMIDGLAELVQIPPHLLEALGENPILDPRGEVIARAPLGQEGVAFADIDPGLADDKRWSNGDLFADRRPELYAPLTVGEVEQAEGERSPFEAAIVQLRSDRGFDLNQRRALDLTADAAANGARLIVLPELCTFAVEEIARDPQQALAQSRVLEDSLSKLCAELGVLVAVSLVGQQEGTLHHSGLLLDEHGQRAGLYHQTHLTRGTRSWAQPGSDLPVFDTSLGRIGMMLGYDADFPEVATILAKRGAEVLVHPTTWNFDWELRLGMPERASENRLNILSAARWDSPVRRGGLINALPTASTPLRAADLNPIWPMEAPHDRELHLRATIDPDRARDKDLLGFDLLRDRRPELYSSLTRANRQRN